MKRTIGTIHQQDGTCYRVNWNRDTRAVWLSRAGLLNNKVVPVGDAASVGEAFHLASEFKIED